MRIRIRTDAFADLHRAYEWYQRQHLGLGPEFLEAVDELLTAIVANPRRHRIVGLGLRRAPLQRFPYGLFYRVTEEEIIVIACLHASRDPRIWKNRR